MFGPGTGHRRRAHDGSLNGTAGSATYRLNAPTADPLCYLFDRVGTCLRAGDCRSARAAGPAGTSYSHSPLTSAAFGRARQTSVAVNTPPAVRANPRSPPRNRRRRRPRRNPRCRKTSLRRRRSTRSRRRNRQPGRRRRRLRRFPTKAATTAAPTTAGLRLTFAPEQSDLSPASIDSVKQLTASAPPGDETTFNVQAYAPGKADDPSTARRISLSRAMAVRSALVADGVPSARIFVRALGEQYGDGPPDRVDIGVNAPSSTATAR